MSANTHDHWYEIPSGSALRQGDVLRDLLVMWFPQTLTIPVARPGDDEELTVKPEWVVGDWIVMSASCDVDRDAKSYPQAVVGRVLPATRDTFGVKTDKDFKERLEVARKGLEPTKFLLPAHPTAEPAFPLSIVQYRVHVTMPTDYLRRSERRLRLRHPFRESFGAWVGANIGRVGPETAMLIPEFIKTFPAHTLKANQE